MWELDSEHDDESHVIQSKVQGDNHEVVNREMIEKIERELQMPPGNYFSTPSGSNSESDRTTLDDQTNANRTWKISSQQHYKVIGSSRSSLW